ncbi:MAG: ATP-binding domain-containing protein [Eubacteriales bacterium]
MVNIIRGQIGNSILSEKLIRFFEKEKTITGNLFLGYPILPTADNKVTVDALLITEEYGVIAFIFYDGVVEQNFEDEQEDVYSALLSRLAKEKNLTKRGNLLVQLDVITYAPNSMQQAKQDYDGFTMCNSEESLKNYLSTINNQNQKYYEFSMRCIQSIGTMKKILSREKAKTENSKGWKLKKLETTVANLDKMQMSAALEISDNVQRIRGLAGSGKTIVLALKAAYLHVSNPELKIAVTFNTRSLKQQFEEMITKFVYEQSESSPNWANINIIHAWGSHNEEGLYYNFCKVHAQEYLDFNKAKQLSSYDDAFNYACKKVLVNTVKYNKMYDIILVDEAQDFSGDFLKLCYEILPDKKRLVYAYDELQSLTVNSMESPEKIFGNDKQGKPRVVLKNRENCAREDIILNVCYRNSRPILSTAHALGFRLYGNIVQMFDDAKLWTDIGYEVESGKLEDDCEVVLKRTSQSSPEFLEAHSEIEDLIQFKTVDTEKKQALFLAKCIKKNLEIDQLEYKDILVIHTNPYWTKRRVGIMRAALAEVGINSHLAGVTTSPDQFFLDESITFTSIFRAKGNEAAMVYVVDGQYCATNYASARSRNILFTAITRSKAWIRVIGVGDEMQDLVNEYNKIKDNGFKLSFTYPNKKIRETLNIIHRDKSKFEEEKIEKAVSGLEQILKDINNGTMYKEDIPENILSQLRGILSNE